jgi:hypothetical protein
LKLFEFRQTSELFIETLDLEVPNRLPNYLRNQMDYRDTPFILKDNKTRWSTKQVLKVLGTNLIEKDAYGIKTKCVLGIRHESAKVTLEHGKYDYECRQCLQENGFDYEIQKQQFQLWLDEHELIDGKWKPHSNPFDSARQAPELTYWKDSEGKPLLYKGAIHIVYGKPSTFKSWFAVNLLGQADVRLWDFENGDASTMQRLQALGIGYEQASGYTVPASESEILDRIDEYVINKPDILVVDGFSGFAEAMNINGEANNEVGHAFAKVFFPLKKAGITVVILDHLPKDASNPDYPIGAQAKRSQADVAILFKHTKSPNVVEIYVAKDRHGEISNRCESGAVPRRFGALTLTSKEDSVSLVVTPAYSASMNGSEITETEADLLEKIYRFVEENPNKAKSAIETSVPGKTERKRKALQQLVDGGYVLVEPVGTSLIHSVGKPLDLSWKVLGD